MAVLRPILALRKAITGKKATPKDLGYKRDPKTGRLTKPGTAAFNEKIEFVKADKKLLTDFYKKKMKNSRLESQEQMYEQKLIDRNKQYNNKLEIMRAERKLSLKNTEASRLASLKKRQITEWVRKLDSLLAVSKKGTVHQIKEKLFQELFNKEIAAIKVSIADKSLQATKLDYLHSLFTSDFYDVLHKSFIPTKLKEMSAKDAVKFIEDISKSAKQRKAIIYKEFRERAD